MEIKQESFKNDKWLRTVEVKKIKFHVEMNKVDTNETGLKTALK